MLTSCSHLQKMVQTRRGRRAAKGKAVAQDEGPSTVRGRPATGRGRPPRVTTLAPEERRERVVDMGEPAHVPSPASAEVGGPSGENAASGVVGQRDQIPVGMIEQLFRMQQQQAQSQQQQQEMLRQFLQEFAAQQSPLIPPPQPQPRQQEVAPAVAEVPVPASTVGLLDTPAVVDQSTREMRNRAAFMKEKPPSFQGGADPEAAASWVQELEKIFAFLECTDAEKVRFATYLLKEGAYRWWLSTSTSLDVEHHPLTWTAFVKVFYDRYFPISVRDIKKIEFANLRQGNMTVDEYEAKFHSLSLFAPSTVANPEEKGQKFLHGLQPYLRERVAILQLRVYDRIVEAARIAEHEARQRVDIRDKKRKAVALGGRQTGGRFGQRAFQMRGRGSGGPGRGQGRGQFFQSVLSPCAQCGRIHPGECRRQSGLCYRCGKPGHRAMECPEGIICMTCGQMGHIARECPKRGVAPTFLPPGQQTSTPGRGRPPVRPPARPQIAPTPAQGQIERAPARVYALNQQDV